MMKKRTTTRSSENKGQSSEVEIEVDGNRVNGGDQVDEDEKKTAKTSTMLKKKLSKPRVLGFLLLMLAISVVFRERLFDHAQIGSSPINWCEPDYVYSEDIAEMFNTISSLLLCVAAIAGPFFYPFNDIKHIEPRLWVIWGLMFIVGAGSVLFHAHLSVMGQVLDEVPIVLLCFYGVILLHPLKWWDENASLKAREVVFEEGFALCLTVGSLLLCLIFPILSHFIVLCCMPFVTIMFARLYSQSEHDDLQTAFRLCAGCVTLAFAAWIPDRAACDPLKAWFIHQVGFYPSFHAVWHLFITLGFWFGVMLGMLMRYSGDGIKSKIAYSKFSGIPYAELV